MFFFYFFLIFFSFFFFKGKETGKNTFFTWSHTMDPNNKKNWKLKIIKLQLLGQPSVNDSSSGKFVQGFFLLQLLLSPLIFSKKKSKKNHFRKLITIVIDELCMGGGLKRKKRQHNSKWAKIFLGQTEKKSTYFMQNAEMGRLTCELTCL